jgi:ribonucleoside-diphosphate reductase beta chain
VSVARFRTTSPAGLDHESLPMRLWHKAKKLGVWDPRDIDLTRDAEDWARLDAPEQDLLLRLTSLFQAGEESVTLELLPLILVIAEEGRLEEEMFLASFLWEEAKHVESFRRFFDEVAHDRSDLSRYHTPNYRRIFYDALPTAMNRLRTDRSPVAQAEASVTYNMIVEGVLAETGYRAYDALLQRNGIMPGMQQVVGHLRRDEARHIAYGVYLLSRLVAEHGDPVWDAIRRRLDALLAPALGVVAEAFQAYDVMPFGLQIQEFTEFALKQFQARVARLERARTQDTAALDREAFSDLDDSV